MDNNKEILESIAIVRMELDTLRKGAAPKEVQMECFNRLIGLYSCLNAQIGVNEVTESMTKKVA